MGWLDDLGNASEAFIKLKEKEKEKKEEEEHNRKMEELRKKIKELETEVWRVDNALNCRKCGRLAEPIEGTYSRYRCSCGNQFASARHSW